ncbi:TadE/TadG family type IV pilus assembly protein [Leucobacter ruminantium]|uniref:TadE/TadG family type IV pilus assembly protein n=1 Tax=Leucobacter ruminantium TaxID=1289170 RepID=UPI001FB60BF9|nr:TadE family protein [Leucobacter ruminantium]
MRWARRGERPARPAESDGGSGAAGIETCGPEFGGAGACIPEIGARSRGLVGDERGTVTAEFAIVLPAVVAVLGLVIGGVALSAHRITLVSASAEVARLEARGETAEQRLAELGTGVVVSRSQRDGLHCVELASRPVGGVLSSIAVRGSSCAALSDAGERR